MGIILRPDYIHSILVDEGEKKHLPEAYQNDLLVHDKNVLAEYETQEFIWILRTCGTFLFPFDQYEHSHYNSRHNWPDKLVEGIKGHFDRTMLFYHFSEGKLTEVTYERALELAQANVTKHLQMVALSQRISALQAEKQAL